MSAKKERLDPSHETLRGQSGKPSRNPRRSQKTILNIATISDASSDSMDLDGMASPDPSTHGGPLNDRLGPPIRCALPALAVSGTANRLALHALSVRQHVDALNASDRIEDGLGTLMQSEVLSLFNDFAPNASLTDRLNQAASLLPVPFLQLVLNHLEMRDAHADDEDESIVSNGRRTGAIDQLRQTIHACLGSLGEQTRFHQAVRRTATDAVYHFAYGLTHEINNPLANIAARAQQLIPTTSRESDRQCLATIVDQSMRAHEMLSEMMRVAKPGSMPLYPCDVGPLLTQVVESYVEIADAKRIAYRWEIADRPMWVDANTASLSEALHCLIRNALEVCRSQDHVQWIGQIVDSHSIPSEHRHRSLGNQVVRIALQDSGPGMSREVAQHAWDLYYSGREHGRGLGIALANVRRILEAHGGLVWICSSPNAGCTVEIRLPLLPSRSPARRTISV